MEAEAAVLKAKEEAAKALEQSSLELVERGARLGQTILTESKKAPSMAKLNDDEGSGEGPSATSKKASQDKKKKKARVKVKAKSKSRVVDKAKPSTKDMGLSSRPLSAGKEILGVDAEIDELVDPIAVATDLLAEADAIGYSDTSSDRIESDKDEDKGEGEARPAAAAAGARARIGGGNGTVDKNLLATAPLPSNNFSRTRNPAVSTFGSGRKTTLGVGFVGKGVQYPMAKASNARELDADLRASQREKAR